MKKIYSILALIGIVAWSATIFLRDTSLMDYEIIRRVLWVAPNFAIVWVGVGFTYTIFPRVFKREFNEHYTIQLVGIIFVILLIFEIIHHLFLNSPFDIWDMIASTISSIIIVLIYIVSKHGNEHLPRK